MITEHEIPKYIKQKESNISKSNRKSKHKHQYEECLIQYPITFAGKSYTKTGLYNYCTICGKIGNRFPGTELYEKYYDKLLVFFVEDIYKEKYVDLKRENNTENNSEGE